MTRGRLIFFWLFEFSSIASLEIVFLTREILELRVFLFLFV